MGVVEIGTPKKKINRQKQSDTNKNKNDQQIKSIKYMYIYMQKHSRWNMGRLPLSYMIT